MPEPKYLRSNTEKSIKAHQKDGNKSDRVLSTSDSYAPTDPVEDNPGYIGTDPIYQNPASHTEKPIQAKAGSVEAKVEDMFLDSEKVVEELDEAVDADEASKEDDKGTTQSTSMPSTGSRN